MKKGMTELVMILDRSGSMGGLESDTIGGYNAMLAKQRTQDGEVLVTTVLFDDLSELLHDRVNLNQIAPITEKEYYVRGCTALLDALGETVERIATIHRYAREEDRPEKTIFVITTDGLENASTKYSYEKVKRLIEKNKEKHGWEFLFLGANMDAVEEAGRFGIKADRAVSYRSDSIGTKLNYDVLSEAVSEMRSASAPIGAGWKSRIEADYKSRG